MRGLQVSVAQDLEISVISMQAEKKRPFPRAFAKCTAMEQDKIKNEIGRYALK